MVCDSTNALREGRSPSEMDVARSLARHHRRAPSGASPSPSSPPTWRASRPWPTRPRAPGASSWWRGGPCIASSAWRWRRAICRPTSSITTRSTSPTWSPTRWCCCAPAARASRARQWPASPRTSIRTSARQGRSRHLLLAHHSRQRARGRAHPEPARRSGLRYRHRRRRAGARHRPSPPRGAEGDVRLGEAAHRHPHARRGAASLRARQARPRRRRQGGARRPQRRHGASGAGAGRDHRRGAGGAAVPRRAAAGAERGRAGARAPLAGLCRHRHRRAGALGPGRDCRTPRSRSTACRPPTPRARTMVDIVRDAVEGTIASIPRERRRDGEMVREAVRRAVRSAVERRLGQAADRQGAADAGADAERLHALADAYEPIARPRGSQCAVQAVATTVAPTDGSRWSNDRTPQPRGHRRAEPRRRRRPVSRHAGRRGLRAAAAARAWRHRRVRDAAQHQDRAAGAAGRKLADRGLPRAQSLPAASIISATRWPTSSPPATS